MHARHVFATAEPEAGAGVCLTGDAFHHLAHVLRARPGMPLILRSPNGRAFASVVESVGRNTMDLRIESEVDRPPAPPRIVTVAQAIGRGDRFEQVLQHCTEVGASAFVPILSERTIATVREADVGAKMKRWRSVLQGAAEQARRDRIPVLAEPIQLRRYLQTVGRQSVVALDGDCPPLREVTPDGPVVLLVGPEGGFSETEAEAMRDAGVPAGSLGPYTLRTEVAPIVAVALLLWA